MGQEMSQLPTTPQEMYQSSILLHSKNNSKGILRLLGRTADKVSAGGLLTLQIVGRIDSTYDDEAEVLEPDNMLQMQEAPTQVRFQVTESLDTPERMASPSRIVMKPSGHSKRPQGRRHVFQVPTAIRYLNLLLTECPHTSCKMAYLMLSKAVATVNSHTLEQRHDNQRSFAATTHAAVCKALVRDLKIDELVDVCDVVRLYSSVSAFRKLFLQDGMATLLTKLSVASTAENLTIVAIFSSLRKTLANELHEGYYDSARAAARVLDPVGALLTSLDVSSVDCTALIEQMSFATLLAQLVPEMALALQPQPANVVPMRGVARYCEYYLSGKHGWVISDACATILMQTLGYLLAYHPAPLAGIDPMKLLFVCRRTTVKYGIHSLVLIYTMTVLQPTLEHIVAQPDVADPANDGNIVACFDSLASILARLVAAVGTENDLLSCSLGKVCCTLQKFTGHERHRALLLSHACAHLLGKHVLPSPGLPDWILVPAIETLGALAGHESLARQFMPIVGERSLVFDINSVVPGLCRLLAASKHEAMSRIKVAESCFRHLGHLVAYKPNALFVFKSMSVAEVWMWRNLRTHLVKLAESIENARQLKAPHNEERTAYAVFYQRMITQARVERDARIMSMRNDIGVHVPSNQAWSADAFDKSVPCLEGYVKETMELAAAMHDRISSFPEIGAHYSKYNERALMVQKWYKKKYAVAMLSKTTREMSRRTRAVTLIQSLWRGRQTRQEHRSALIGEMKRRDMAIIIQRHYREHVRNWKVNWDKMIAFICNKMLVPFKDAPASDRVKKLPRLRRCVVSVKAWNYQNTIRIKEDAASRHYTLVLFYSHATSRTLLTIYERIAILFSEHRDLVIASVDGSEESQLITDMRIPGFPYLRWYDKEGNVHEYTPDWPAKPLSLKEPIRNHMAIIIQRKWRNTKVKAAYRQLRDKIKHHIAHQRRVVMQEACETGNSDKVRYLLREGYDVNQLCLNGSLPLNIAIQHGHKTVFGDLLKGNADVNVADEHGHTPAFFAMAAGHHEALRMLAKNGADLRAIDNWGRNLLHVACESGQESMALLLLNLGVEGLTSEPDQNTYTPLDYALSSGLEKICLRLMSRGIPVNPNIQTGFIFHSMLRGMEAITKLVISQNLADLNQHDGTADSWAPIHYAAALGQVSVLKKLIQSKVDFDAVNAEGQTALHLAAQKGNLLCVNLLFNAMAVPTEVLLTMTQLLPLEERALPVDPSSLGPYVDSGGNTVLHYACSQPSMSTFSERLISGVVDAEELPGPNVSGNTPLHYAAAHGIYFVTLQLARRLAPLALLDNVNENGNTPLHLAMSAGHKEIVQMLLEVGADMDVLDRAGNTLLHFAVSSHAMIPSQQLIAVQFLLQAGHPAYITNEDGHTPVHLAASFGLFGVVQELVSKEPPERGRRKVFVNKLDNAGNSALHFACKRSKMETDKASPNYPYNNPMILYLMVEGANASIANNQGVRPSDLVYNDNVIKRGALMRVEREQDEELLELM